MTSGGAIASLIILFIMIATIIILSILALVINNKTSKRRSFTVHEFKGYGTSETFELVKHSYFNYDVDSDAYLTISGRKHISAIICNNSSNTINIIPHPNVPVNGTKFHVKKYLLDDDYKLNANKTILIYWKDDENAKIVKL